MAVEEGGEAWVPQKSVNSALVRYKVKREVKFASISLLDSYYNLPTLLQAMHPRTESAFAVIYFSFFVFQSN